MEILAVFWRKHSETESAPGNHHRCVVPMQLGAGIQASATTVTTGSTSLLLRASDGLGLAFWADPEF